MDHVLEKLRARLPSDGELGQVRDRLEQDLAATYSNPPVDELEAVLRSRFTPERARQLLFSPFSSSSSIESLVRFYPALLLSPPPHAPPEHPQSRVQKLTLSLTVLVHSENPRFTKEFIQLGGLRVLASLVSDSDMLVRGQSLEILRNITGDETLDLFKNPPEVEQLQLHPWLLELVDGTRFKFVHGLTSNFVADDGVDEVKWRMRINGTSMLALQVLGFFFSWVRLFYCKENILRVSGDIIEALRKWSVRDDIAKEEADFAKTLYEDFKRFPAEQSDGGSVVISPKDGSKPSVPEKQEEVKEEDGLSRKAKGNAFFAQGKYECALQEYEQALCEMEQSSADKVAQVHGNMGAAHMELWKRNRKDVDHLSKCVVHCKQAIQLNEKYTKAYFRLAQAQIEIGDYDEAHATIQGGKAVCTDNSEQSAFEKLSLKLGFLSEESEERKRELEDIYQAFLNRLFPSQRLNQDDSNRKEEKLEATSSNHEEAKLTGMKSSISLKSSKAEQEEQKSASASIAETAIKLSQARQKGTSGKASIKKTKEDSLGAKKGSAASAKKKTRELRRLNLQDLASSLLELNVDEFRKTFGANLDEELLVKVVNAADGLLPGRAAEALQLLDNLSQVERFSLVLMFLPQVTLDRIPSIFAILKSALKDQGPLVEVVCSRFRDS